MRISSPDYLSPAQKEAVIITKNGKSGTKFTAFKDPKEFLVKETKDGYNLKR
ncbi:MAG: hypothetical protein GX335_00120 [Firmicutes bacterium]|nr:hypothetical protein [Bacillota bacterium]